MSPRRRIQKSTQGGIALGAMATPWDGSGICCVSPRRGTHKSAQGNAVGAFERKPARFALIARPVQHCEISKKDRKNNDPYSRIRGFRTGRCQREGTTPSIVIDDSGEAGQNHEPGPAGPTGGTIG
jgi:hypothetical protein